MRAFVRHIYVLFAFLTYAIQAQYGLAATSGEARMRMKGFVEEAMAFTERMPREKVFVHLDNTSYFKGDKIWFQAYVVDGFSNGPTQLSKTLYVELLNPGGKVVGRQTLRIEDGRARGSMSIGHLPFYSGFYEVRAYTKYMTNFGNECAFSRVIPVFDSPRREGDYTDRRIMSDKLARSRFESPRPASRLSGKMSVRFYPEGGHLAAGLTQKVAFELTGKGGIPLDGRGVVVDDNGLQVATLSVEHEGRGVFEICPVEGRKYKAEITASSGDTRTFSLPQAEAGQIALSVDNVTQPDTIGVSIRRVSDGTRRSMGVAVTVRGVIWSYAMTDVDSVAHLKFAASDMPTGVSVITLFDTEGRTIADRMVFVNNGGYGLIEIAEQRNEETPNSRITIDVTALTQDSIPASLPLSVSVVDGDNAVARGGGMLAELLLMSEVKGYIRNPEQYFAKDGEAKRALDLLLMVQGWRCFSWEHMAGVRPVDRVFLPEQGIDVSGKVVSFVRGIPKPNVNLSAMMMPVDTPDSLKYVLTNMFTTDSAGRFHFSVDVAGSNKLVLSVTENGKKKDHRILVDRLFAPEPRAYRPQEMRIEDSEPEIAGIAGADTIVAEEEMDDAGNLYEDDGIKSKLLDEVVVKGKRRTAEQEIYRARSKSVAFYDVDTELADVADKGQVIGQSLFDMLVKINSRFSKRFEGAYEKIRYNGKEVLFVIDYKPTMASDSLSSQNLYLESIKSIYINEDDAVKLRYADPIKYTMMNIADIGCAVFIETDPNMSAPPAKGTRRVSVQGYSVPAEFQNIDSVDLIDEEDFRRTLYWNPDLRTGDDGSARIEFYNNTTCRNLMINVYGIGRDGLIFSR